MFCKYVSSILHGWPISTAEAVLAQQRAPVPRPLNVGPLEAEGLCRYDQVKGLERGDGPGLSMTASRGQEEEA